MHTHVMDWHETHHRIQSPTQTQNCECFERYKENITVSTNQLNTAAQNQVTGLSSTKAFINFCK